MSKKGITCERDVMGSMMANMPRGQYISEGGNKFCQSCDCILLLQCTQAVAPDYKERQCSCTECDCLEIFKEENPALAKSYGWDK